MSATPVSHVEGEARRRADAYDHPLEHHFERFATTVSRWAGHSVAFFAAVILVAGWAVSGPVFNFSDTWQLVINTGTTVLTFLMVFLIQNTMNRDSAALHLKLDELIRVTSQARNALIGAERLDEEQIEQLEKDATGDGA